MDILLTHGYFLCRDPIEQQIMKPYPPLGLLYVSSHLKSRGFNVKVLDTTFSSPQDFDRDLENSRPSVVGIYANLMTRQNVLKAVSKAKHIGATVILGGPEPVNYPDQYLSRGTDIIVAGEGELTLEALIPHLSKYGTRRLHEVQGIVFRDDDGRIVTTPPRAQIDSLDEQPFPDRNAVDMSRYLHTWRQHHGLTSVSLITARGCPYTCRWCSHSVYGFSHRRRTPENVAAELQWLRERYDPDQVWYADDVFGINRRWLFRFAEVLKKHDLRIPFETISREDRLNEAVISTLADMGCSRLWVGAESGSQSVLNAMDRRTNARRMREVIGQLKAAGIRTGTFIMLGYDGERWKDIDDTVTHLKAALPDEVLATLAYPIKGTPFYEQVADRVIPLKSWEQGSDRDFTVRGRGSRRFYDHARKWLLAEVGLARAQKCGSRDLGRMARIYATAKKHRMAMYLTRHQVENG